MSEESNQIPRSSDRQSLEDWLRTIPLGQYRKIKKEYIHISIPLDNDFMRNFCDHVPETLYGEYWVLRDSNNDFYFFHCIKLSRKIIIPYTESKQDYKQLTDGSWIPLSEWQEGKTIGYLCPQCQDKGTYQAEKPENYQDEDYETLERYCNCITGIQKGYQGLIMKLH